MPPPDSPQAQWFNDQVCVHEPALRAYIRSRFPDLRDVDDLVQESYVKMYQAAQTESITYPKSYLFTVAQNIARAIFRRPRTMSDVPVTDFQVLRIPEESADVVASVICRQEAGIIRDAIDVLPGRCREIFVLRKLKGLSQKEIAAKLGLSEQTVQVQVARGARKCEKFLRAHGVARK